jgi:hypothetical protein
VAAVSVGGVEGSFGQAIPTNLGFSLSVRGGVDQNTERVLDGRARLVRFASLGGFGGGCVTVNSVVAATAKVCFEQKHIMIVPK